MEDVLFPPHTLSKPAEVAGRVRLRNEDVEYTRFASAKAIFDMDVPDIATAGIRIVASEWFWKWDS